MKIIKKCRDFIMDNSLPLFEIIILIIIGCVPHIFDVKEMFKKYLDDTILSPDNALYYLAIKKGNYCITIILVIITLVSIRKYDEDKTLNVTNTYHNYWFIWYWFCSKILGFKKCNLVLVPIFMQFKLISNGIFEEYPLDDSTYPDDETSEIKVDRTNWASTPTVINVILEDTYPIKQAQLPQDKMNLPTIKISRNNGNDFGRYFSQNFINKIITEIRKLPSNVTINLFATTNPKNTVYITKSVFMTGGRGNIMKLLVFQQESIENRIFMSKGKRVY